MSAAVQRDGRIPDFNQTIVRICRECSAEERDAVFKNLMFYRNTGKKPRFWFVYEHHRNSTRRQG